LIRAELYKSGRPVVVVQRGQDASPGAWARLQEAYARGIVDGSPTRADVRADVFLAELDALRDVRRLFGETIQLGPALEAQLRLLLTDRKALDQALAAPPVFDPHSLSTELLSAGFTRTLKPFQLRNLSRIRGLPHGADFSVPGAGKTSVALANFALLRAQGAVQQMLVVAPIAAFEAWKEDSVECIAPPPVIVVHAGPDSLIPDNCEILLTNYNRVVSDYDRIRAFVAARPTQVVLDEAHRIKRGEEGVHGRAVLDLAYAAQRRDVLTGTPAPQGAFDLIALIQFLYPGRDRQILPASAYRERDSRDADVVSATHAAISRYFVRTKKTELSLPEPKFLELRQPMGAIQQAIYDALLGRYKGAFQVNVETRREWDRIGRIVMYLLEAATNPMLLMAGSDDADEKAFAHPPLEVVGGESLASLLHTYNLYETPWKYGEVRRLVTEASRDGQKTIVWSNFVRNLRALARHLEEFHPAIIHGGVPLSDGDEPTEGTREFEFSRFRRDDRCRVLLANPAACGEGVSLHHWCHHAVYLDRTFNAGLFLQSQDRIHRLGLEEGITTRFTILTSQSTIDDTVHTRLRDKVIALSRLMDDPGLVRLALPESDEGHSGPPAYADDVQAVLTHISENSRRVA
jgi:SNF2 family DNA or RNA helicase